MAIQLKRAYDPPPEEIDGERLLREHRNSQVAIVQCIKEQK